MQPSSHQPAQSEAIVLRTRPHGEQFVACDVLSPDWGLITIYHRRGKLTGSLTQPDLFDIGEWQVRFKDSDKHAFSSSFHLHHRPRSIAAHYRVYCEAARWAGFLCANSNHLEDPATVYRHAIKVFQAFETGVRADVTFLKGVFQLAIDEGYAVREQWLPGLQTPLRKMAVYLLRTPLCQIECDPEAVNGVRKSLLHYLAQTAEFIIEEDPLSQRPTY